MKKKLTVAMLLGIIALNVATVSMSIAWYSNSSTVNIDPIDISIVSDRDLKIATEVDGDYVDHLDYSKLKPSSLFVPVTTAHSSSWLDNKESFPLYYDDAKYSQFSTSEELKPVENGYYMQEFYLQSDDDIYVTINPKLSFINPNQEYNKGYAHELYERYQKGENEDLKKLSEETIYQRLNDIVKAMRFSILVVDEDNYSFEVIDPYQEEETYLGGLLDNDLDGYYDYYRKEDGKLYERVYGDLIGDYSDIVFDEPAEDDSPIKNPQEDTSAFNASHKSGVRTFNLEKTRENNVFIRKESAHKLSDFDSNAPFHFPVKKEGGAKIVISIYIEGWDLDSVNYTMGATFDASLALKVEREMV